MNNFHVKERLEWLPPQPFDFGKPYRLADYSDDRIQQIMFKYLQREMNLLRAWVRISHHMPETVSGGEKLSCLEFGTAHGAMLEIWRHFGHRVVGTDWPWRAGNEVPAVPSRPWHHAVVEGVRAVGHDHSRADPVEGWAYQPIIESLGLDVRHIDGRSWPYPFEDKSFDVVCAYQAIDAFGSPEEWSEIVAEFCRIARKIVVVGYNPLPKTEARKPERQEAAREAWLRLQNFSAHGMRTVFTEFGTTRRGLHPVAMKFIPIDAA